MEKNKKQAIYLKKHSDKRILYFIQLPPPIHGVSVLNNIILNSTIINDNFRTTFLRINFSQAFHDIRKLSLKKFLILVQLSWKLLILIHKFNPDIIYFSLMPVGKGFLRDAWFATLMKLRNNKVVFHLNNRGIPRHYKNIFYRILYRIIFRNVYIIHVSDLLLKTEILSKNFKLKKTFVLGNTIQDHYYSKKSNTKNKNFISILYISNYLKEKGLMILLQVVKTLIEKGFSIKLNTYGNVYDSKEFKKYKDYVLKHNLSSNVFIHGPVYGKEKYKALSMTDIFAFPSYFEEECFPLSILEAMQAGLAIVSTNIGAIPEMINNGQEGLLVDPKNTTQFKESIEILINDHILRLKLGNNALNKFNKKYSLSIFENKLKNILQTEIFSK